MKSKRWKRRNRHTRPEWVEAYKYCDFKNRLSWKAHKGYWGVGLKYSYPMCIYLVSGLWLVGNRDIQLSNTSPQHRQIQPVTTT